MCNSLRDPKIKVDKTTLENGKRGLVHSVLAVSSNNVVAMYEDHVYDHANLVLYVFHSFSMFFFPAFPT